MPNAPTIDLFASLKELRARAPLVHNITNDVVMNVTANALLAVGASPAMVHAPEEAAELARLAAALVVNIGTLTKPAFDAMALAVETAAQSDVPWVLDPVAVAATEFRRVAVAKLLAARPTVVRGNASEIHFLATGERTARGVDAAIASTETAAAAKQLAVRTGAVVAMTGAIDFVTDGASTIAIANGHPLLQRITGSGCTATALIGAFLGARRAPLEAAVSALALLGLAGERAAVGGVGPGTFQVRVLDALAAITPEALVAEARLS